MKGKKLKQLMILITAVVWGLILYRVYQSYFSEPVIALPPPVQTRAPVVEQAVQKDTVELLANYRDPFLKYARKGDIKPAPAKKVIPKVKAPPPTPAPPPKWPEITFSGLIKNPGSGVAVGLLIINSKTHLVRAGETVQAITIKQMTLDSIQLSFAEQQRTLLKNQSLMAKQ